MEMEQGQKIESKTAYELLKTWREYPHVFCKDVLGIDLIWDMQDKLLKACPQAIREHKPIYVASGHALGKDYICAAISLWFLYSHSPSIVIQTAPTDRQVKKIMWGETLRHYNNKKVDLGGITYADPHLEIAKGEWYLLGFTTKESGASKKAQGGRFQGFHSPSICAIISEAQAVEDSIYDQIDAITTSENVLIIFIGNPTTAQGRFARGLKDKEHNIVFNFSCLDNPNYKEKRVVIPGLASYEWVEDKRQRWGEEDPRWFGRVLGQLPKTSINNIFSQSVIDLMLLRKDVSLGGTNGGVAIDVAGEGDDSNVIYAGKNGRVEKEVVKLSQPPSSNALNCQLLCRDIEGNFIVVDCDGLGIGTYQELAKIKDLQDINLVKFHGCGASTKKKEGDESYQFENLRAEAWFTALERAKDGKAFIPDDDILIEELLEPKYFINSKGKIQIEDKRDIKDRLGRSPDRADAWIMLQWGFSQEYTRFNQREEEYGDRQGHGERVGYEEPSQYINIR